MNLFEKLNAKTTDYVARVTETTTLTVTRIASTKNADRVMVTTKECKDNIFVFRNCFPQGVPTISGATSMDFTLAESKDGNHINVTEVTYDYADLGKYNFVATTGASVTL